MASVKEIFKNRVESGEIIPDVGLVIEDYPAETDQIAFAKIAEAMPDDFPDADMPKEITFPSVSVIAKDVLGLKDDPKNMKGARTAEQKFIEDFPKKVNQFKKDVEENEVFGKRGWDTVKKVWQSAMNDATEEQIRKDRERILNGEDLDGIKGAIAKANGFTSKIFAPRQQEALLEGRDPTWQDYAGDAIENGLMTVPTGGIVGALGKTGKYASKVLANPVISNVVGNSAAPILTEAADAAMRGDSDPNTERSDFSLGDALWGAATNMGVKFGLLRGGANSARLLNQQLRRSAGGETSPMMKIAKILESADKTAAERGLPTPTSKMGRVIDFARPAAVTLGINKYGGDKDAEFALSRLNGVPVAGIMTESFTPMTEKIKTIREEEKQEMQDRKTRAKISDVLGKETLTPKDEFYLGVIAQDPSVVKFGYADENHSNDDFKLWLLTRGNDLLKGTAAHRKTWEISND